MDVQYREYVILRVQHTLEEAAEHEEAGRELSAGCYDALRNMRREANKLARIPKTRIGRWLMPSRMDWIMSYIADYQRELNRSMKS